MAGRGDMAINSVRTALQLLTGAGELTRARAMEAAGTLLELPGVGDTSMRAGQLAEELLQAAAANQQLVHELVRTEFERQLTRLGLVRGSDLAAAQQRIEVLEAEVAALRAASTARAAPASAGTEDKPRRASRSSVQRAAVKKAATRSAAGPGPNAATGARGSVAAKRAATKNAAKKSATKKSASGTAAAKTGTDKAAPKQTRPKKQPGRGAGR